MPIVSLATAKMHLRLTDDASNADLKLKLDQATQIILDYLARPADATWTATLATWGTTIGSPATAVPAPATVQAAILAQVAELYRFRGDDLETPTRDVPGDLSPSIKMLLCRLRDPVFA